MVRRIAWILAIPTILLTVALLVSGSTHPAAAASATHRRAATKAPAKTPAATRRATVAAPADTSRSYDPLVYMSWHRPYGMRGATSDLTPSTRPDERDTLWLVVEPRRASKLYGISIQLAIHPAAGDTLDPEWHFGGGSENPRHVHVEWPQPSWPVRDPWPVGGFGAVRFERRADYGWLNILYAVNSDSAGSVIPGTRYALARISFPAMSREAAKRAVCIEWASGEWGFDLQLPEGQPADGGARFVSVSSPDGAVCRSHRAAIRPNPYRYGMPIR